MEVVLGNVFMSLFLWKQRLNLIVGHTKVPFVDVGMSKAGFICEGFSHCL